jgi:hypothetical protein
MGASAREIEREIKATRDRMDDNLTRLEDTAASRAMRYGKVAAIGIGIVAAAGVAYLVYRRTRKPTLRNRLEGVSVDRVRALVEKLRDEMPSVTIHLNEKSEPGTVEAVIRKVAPAVVTTAATAILERLVRSPEPPQGK